MRSILESENEINLFNALKYRVLTVASDAFVARIARARVAVDVVGARAVKTRAAGAFVDVSCKQCIFELYLKHWQNMKK